MKKLLYLLLSILPLSLTQCEERDDEKEEFPSPMPPYVPPGELPPETQEGWNFFGCRVNGEVWVPRTGSLPVHADYENGFFFVTGKIRYNNSPSEQISLGHRQVFTVGKYLLADTNVGGAISLFYGCTYETNSIDTGELEITKIAYDTNRGGHIISGRFHFTVITPGCDTLRVTDGRFDIFD